MAFLASTQSIIEHVERLTHRPVHITEDASLDTLARITIARGDAPMHLLRYKPAGAAPPDYNIAYQCGFVLRLYTAPPERRFDIGVNDEGRKKMQEALVDARLPKEMRGMGDFLLASLITQLRTYPVGLRVDHWLHETYPELRALQKQAIQAQLEQNLEVIGVAREGMFPRKVMRANLSMNAAFALFWSTLWKDASITLPYKAAGYIEDGHRLMKVFDRIPDDPALDTPLIDEWAFALGLKGWYSSVPHTLNP